MFAKKTKQKTRSFKKFRGDIIMKTKQPSSFLKDRRELLGLDQQVVASEIGVQWDTYRQWECRGQIPENNISDIARVLRVSELDLLIAKYKPLLVQVFGLEPDALEIFLRRHSKR